jgi:hypothetical protein
MNHAAELRSYLPLRRDLDVREQQVTKFRILQMVRNRLSVGHPLSGFLIGFEVRLNGFGGRSLGRFDCLSVGRDREIGHLHRKPLLGLFQHDQKSHHLTSILIFFTVAAARPTGKSALARRVIESRHYGWRTV